jgi:hypothetical protein
MDLAVRPLQADEHVLVADSWTRSTVAPRQAEDTRSGTRYVARVGLDGTNVRVMGWAWYEMHRAWVHRFLADPSSVVLVAVLPNLPSEALGWVALTPPCEHPLVIHYCYTIVPSRRRQVASTLMRAAYDKRDGRKPRYSHSGHLGQMLIDRVEREHRAAAPMRSEAVMR